MSDKPSPPPTGRPLVEGHSPLSRGHQPIANDGYVPVSKGHQPIAVSPGLSTAQGGYQPTTSQGAPGPGTPPSQGSGGKKD